ncbi:hypothetical protein BAUCODRAFT_333255 [Baudoinia panamericana UAMH 10762]|uniref:Uncharacterized protein n=1 Tax=Baudoinia panamericana (strain UAMH 10762) TaxID=717646 RepID=M2MXR0_BAUPA|nr:uncharacterized protein BAUCODRAFT_333255 [Baudoinia panamericana UAMH 10762]EMC91025.1 hypothetical protein BAUCODRAFT_333255 [Baudoinia panamericana UAMH 10762]
MRVCATTRCRSCTSTRIAARRPTRDRCVRYLGTNLIARGHPSSSFSTLSCLLLPILHPKRLPIMHSEYDLCNCIPCLVFDLGGYVDPDEGDAVHKRLAQRGFTLPERKGLSEEWDWHNIENEAEVRRQTRHFHLYGHQLKCTRIKGVSLHPHSTPRPDVSAADWARLFSAAAHTYDCAILADKKVRQTVKKTVRRLSRTRPGSALAEVYTINDERSEFPTQQPKTSVPSALCQPLVAPITCQRTHSPNPKQLIAADSASFLVQLGSSASQRKYTDILLNRLNGNHQPRNMHSSIKQGYSPYKVVKRDVNPKTLSSGNLLNHPCRHRQTPAPRHQ